MKTSKSNYKTHPRVAWLMTAIKLGTSKITYVILVLLLFLVACEKDAIDVDQEIFAEKPSPEDILTGEDIEGTIQPDDQRDTLPVAAMEEKLRILDLKPRLLVPEKQVHSRSRYFYPLYCGYYNIGNTTTETNTASFYPGPDRIYFFTLTSEKRVWITLSEMSADHDLFLTETERSSSSWLRMGSTIATSLNTGRDNEVIDLVLPAGTYFMVVDAYQGSSRFKLKLECRTPSFTSSCDSHDDLVASYSTGVSEQSSYWKKWSSRARDGKVLFESYERYPNKVIKFDQYRFGYQDVVRSLTNYHIIGGMYEMEFDIRVPYGKRAEFVSEKLSRFGRYGQQGFKVKFQNGNIDFTHGGITARARTNYPFDRWFKVKIYFDMTNNQIHLKIGDHTLVSMSASATTWSGRSSIRSIWGLDFFADNFYSYFHLDNFCVKRHNYSFVPAITSDLELINLVPR